MGKSEARHFAAPVGLSESPCMITRVMVGSAAAILQAAGVAAALRRERDRRFEYLVSLFEFGA